MIINGAGITEFECKINKDFDINTTYSFSFFELYGGHGCIDRGASEDTYESTINILGTKTVITDFLTQLNNNRMSTAVYKNILILDDFNSGEKIFGADIDYTKAIVVTPITERRVQRTLTTWSLQVRLIAQDLSFITVENEFPNLNYIDIGVDADADISTNKLFSLNNYFHIIDHDYDSGVFKGRVQLTQADMAKVRAWQRVNRGAIFSIPLLGGIDNPFGIRDSSNVNVRLLEIEDEKIIGYNCGEPMWQCNLTFSEEF